MRSTSDSVNTRIHVRLFAMLGAGLLALQLAACASEPGPEDASSATSAEGAAQASGGESTSGAAENEGDATTLTPEELDGALVDSFPAEVPLYEGEILNSLSALSEVSEAPEWNATIRTDDAIETVDQAIRDDYSTNGWSIGSDMEFAGGYQLVARGNGYIVSITYNDLDGSGITINYGVSEAA